jgi:hypothetical protein
MSLRIIGPPPRTLVLFDDEARPLTSKAIDDDYGPALPALAYRVYPQPLADDDVFGLSAKAIDEDAGALPIVLAVRICPQPSTDDESRPLPGTGLDDDGAFAFVVVAPRAIALQFFGDEERVPQIAPTLEDDPWTIPLAVGIRIAAQPGCEDEIYAAPQPPFVDEDAGVFVCTITPVPLDQPISDEASLGFGAAIDEEIWSPLAGVPWRVTAQPATDDGDRVVPPAPFFVEDDSGTQFLALPVRLVSQPLGDDGDLPQQLLIALDDDAAAWLYSIANRVAGQPPSDDGSELPPRGITDDDGWYAGYSARGTTQPTWFDAGTELGPPAAVRLLGITIDPGPPNRWIIAADPNRYIIVIDDDRKIYPVQLNG